MRESIFLSILACGLLLLLGACQNTPPVPSLSPPHAETFPKELSSGMPSKNSSPASLQASTPHPAFAPWLSDLDILLRDVGFLLFNYWASSVVHWLQEVSRPVPTTKTVSATACPLSQEKSKKQPSLEKYPLSRSPAGSEKSKNSSPSPAETLHQLIHEKERQWEVWRSTTAGTGKSLSASEREKGREMQEELAFLYLAEGNAFKSAQLLKPLTFENSKKMALRLLRLGLLYDWGETAQAFPELQTIYTSWQRLFPFAIKAIIPCQRISGYGDYEPLTPPTLAAGQSLLLYILFDHVSLQRSKSEQGPSQGTWKLSLTLWTRGWEKDFPDQTVPQLSFHTTVQKKYRSPIHDFFLPVVLYLPSSLSTGTYEVEVQAQDNFSLAKEKKTIDFNVK